MTPRTIKRLSWRKATEPEPCPNCKVGLLENTEDSDVAYCLCDGRVWLRPGSTEPRDPAERTR